MISNCPKAEFDICPESDTEYSARPDTKIDVLPEYKGFIKGNKNV